ncbi:hypothetical protein I5M27_14355 [Adhaeribacter sp. BT258]|uniref:TonB C-terminal domain-containing protein n=1 Tax=Adhaeribacter terrigena TaxID=2793070 RepID=A0ABS1C490_9BACT|nr:hypothetical protein [Adhaeribacter terrigena]MBK0404174.1 hypothetical protein [Adhaeribacter terrigena]
MKIILSVLFLICIPNIAMSQKHEWSALYSNNGTLRADSSFKISDSQFQVWQRIEGNVCTLISSNLMYPSIAERNGVEGNVIIAFNYKKGVLDHIRIVRGEFDFFNQSGLESMQKASAYILREFKYWQNKMRDNFDGTYYVAIDFSLIPYQKALKEKQAIPVIKLSPGPFSGHGH